MKTKHVRIPTEWHKIFKLEAAEKVSTITKILSELFEKYHPKGKSYGKSDTK